MAGKAVPCPSCKTKLTVPGASIGHSNQEMKAAPRGSLAKSLRWSAPAVALIVGILIGHFVWPRGQSADPAAAGAGRGRDIAGPEAMPRRAATIIADPNPVRLGPTNRGTTRLRWDTADGTVGQVYGSYNDKPEQLIADNQTAGSKDFPWIDRGNVYTFRLYAGKTREKLLASVTVTTE